LFDGKVIRDTRHLRAWLHYFASGAPVQADDLQDDFFLGLLERSFLVRELQQLAIFLVVQSGLWPDGFEHAGGENGAIDGLGGLAQRQADFFQEQQRPRDSQRPFFWSSHRKSFRQHFASKQNDDQQTDYRGNERPAILQGHPKRDRLHPRAGERIAQHH